MNAGARKRLILHIGMHKTGSTAVQRYFSRNRWILKRMGVCYPSSIGPGGVRQPKHNAIFTAISHEADFGAPHPQLGPSSSVIRRTADEIDAAPGRLAVISAEGLSGERDIFSKQLAPLAKRFDVQVLIFLRRPDEWVESFYKQMVVSREVRETRTFDAFMTSPEVQAHLRFEEIISWWRGAFGDDRVAVRVYHPSGPQRPLAEVLRLADMGRPFTWLNHTTTRENASPSVEAVEFVRQCNRDGVEAPREAGQMIDARLGSSARRYLSNEERKTFLQNTKEWNQGLAGCLSSCDLATLWPNEAKIGRENEWGWGGQISAKFKSDCVEILRLSN